MKKNFTVLLFAAFALSLAAQNPGDNFFPGNQVHEIRFQFSQPGYFDSLKNNYLVDVYMRCDVKIDGAAFPTSGVKYKGNSSYNNPSRKKPFRVDLAEYVNGQEHNGLKKLVLNNAFKDPSFLREKLMLDFLNEHQIAAPRATFTRLYINDHYWGLYTVVEDVSKPFLESRFGNNGGNLFKGDPKGSLQWKGWQQSLYETDYELKTNEDENDWSDLIAFLNALNNTPDPQLADSLDRRLNLDSWFSYWAAHNIFANLDSYVGSGHNYFLYHNSVTDKFEWITWDVNEAFGNFRMNLTLQNIENLPFTHIPQPPQSRPIMNRLLQNPAMKQRLAARVCQLVQDFSNAKMDARIDELANLIRPHVYADTLKTYPNNIFEMSLLQDIPGGGGPGGGTTAGLKPFLSIRQNALLSQLAAYGCAQSGVSQSVDFQEIEISPNPAVESVFVNLKNFFPKSGSFGSGGKISIFDLSGRLVFEEILETKNQDSEFLEVPVADLSSGFYFLKIEVDEISRGGKFVKI